MSGMKAFVNNINNNGMMDFSNAARSEGSTPITEMDVNLNNVPNDTDNSAELRPELNMSKNPFETEGNNGSTDYGNGGIDKSSCLENGMNRMSEDERRNAIRVAREKMLRERAERAKMAKMPESVQNVAPNGTIGTVIPNRKEKDMTVTPSATLTPVKTHTTAIDKIKTIMTSGFVIKGENVNVEITEKNARIDSEINGTISCHNLYIGKALIEGNIVSDKSIILSEDACAKGNIHGKRIYIYGKFEGDLTSDEKLVIYKTANISGRINALGTVEVHPGAILNGTADFKAITETVEPTETVKPEENAENAENTEKAETASNGMDPRSIPGNDSERIVPVETTPETVPETVPEESVSETPEPAESAKTETETETGAENESPDSKESSDESTASEEPNNEPESAPINPVHSPEAPFPDAPKQETSSPEHEESAETEDDNDDEDDFGADDEDEADDGDVDLPDEFFNNSEV